MLQPRSLNVRNTMQIKGLFQLVIAVIGKLVVQLYEITNCIV